MTVTLANEADEKKTWKIVGEDESDAARGKISHVSPLAVALFGKSVGDAVTAGGHKWEIVSLDAVD
jgi:transcription elongation GreA/GreB family factor